MKDNSIQLKELAFFGKITASVSHELNNVLSIINEYSGLLEDLMYACRQGKPMDCDRVEKIAQNISEQIKRQKSIIKLLNRFAHRVDTPIASFNINEMLNDICRLSQRFASLKKVNLDVKLPDFESSITNSPFVLQHAVFSAIILALDYCNENDTIYIEANNETSYKIINITTQPILDNESSLEKTELISSLMRNMGGDFKRDRISDNKECLKFYIPTSIVPLEKD